ncbi:class I SAM-dependent methyltransferase [Brevibacillus sp. SAFN-007a]|uniref:class I SAM-dependent methyltransferase n=1 Tax=Brevibacillus sp. SAFN-007a TaxID=3436862 RepID=UPI003F7D8863
MTSNNFDSIAHLYDQTRAYPSYIYPIITELIEMMTELTPDASKVCEIGIGTGRMALSFIKKGYEYYGVDISENMMALLKEKLCDIQNQDKVKLQLADATKLPFETGMFDLIWGTKVLRHIPNWHDVINESKRVLKKGGYFIHGEEYWVSEPPTKEVRNRWEEFILDQNEKFNKPPGTVKDDEIVECIRSNGGSAKIITLGTWPVIETFSSKIDHFANRGGSSTFGVSDKALKISIELLKKWAIDKYGDLNEPHQGIRGYRVVIGKF